MKKTARSSKIAFRHSKKGGFKVKLQNRLSVVFNCEKVSFRNLVSLYLRVNRAVFDSFSRFSQKLQNLLFDALKRGFLTLTYFLCLPYLFESTKKKKRSFDC